MIDTMWTAAASRSPMLERLDMSAPLVDPERARQAVADMKSRTERMLRAFRKVPVRR